MTAVTVSQSYPLGHLLRQFCPRSEMSGEVCLTLYLHSEELVLQTGGLPLLR